MYVGYRTSLGFVGAILKYLSPALLFPAVVALYYGENTHPYLVTVAVMFGMGTCLERL